MEEDAERIGQNPNFDILVSFSYVVVNPKIGISIFFYLYSVLGHF